MDAGAWNLTTEKSVAIAIIYKNLIWLQQSKLKTLFPGFVKNLGFKIHNTSVKNWAPPWSIFYI